MAGNLPHRSPRRIRPRPSPHWRNGRSLPIRPYLRCRPFQTCRPFPKSPPCRPFQTFQTFQTYPQCPRCRPFPKFRKFLPSPTSPTSPKYRPCLRFPRFLTYRPCPPLPGPAAQCRRQPRCTWSPVGSHGCCNTPARTATRGRRGGHRTRSCRSRSRPPLRRSWRRWFPRSCRRRRLAGIVGPARSPCPLHIGRGICRRPRTLGNQGRRSSTGTRFLRATGRRGRVSIPRPRSEDRGQWIRSRGSRGMHCGTCRTRRPRATSSRC
jgi:hypothetical protein